METKNTKITILSILIIILALLGWFFLSKIRYTLAPTIKTTNVIQKIINQNDHQINTAELAQTKELFAKNNLDLNNLRFMRFESDDERQQQVIYAFHVAADQFYKGLPLFTENIIYHFNKSTGKIISVSGERISALNLSVTPKISLAEATKKSGLSLYNLQGELGIYSLDETPADNNSDFKHFLAWKITPRDNKYPVAYINAINGDLLYYFNGIFN